MNYETIINELNEELSQFDFECYPFKVEWYNENVDSRFRLDLNGDTLGVLVLNTPGMFEKIFLPYLFGNFKKNGGLDDLQRLSDPIDTCLSLKFDEVKEKLAQKLKERNSSDNTEILAIKDHELDPRTRRAKIVMQTCAHISGAAYFYNANLLGEKVSEIKKKNLMGVCLHGKYGGWFAMRCVYLFKNFHVDENLRRKDPIDPLHNDFNRIFDTLKKFNDSWRDSTYRSTFTVLQKYSHIQQEYFKTVPNDRKRLLEKWLRFKDQNSLCTFYESEHMYRTDYKQYLINNFYFV